jgi:hypothetical protein
MLLYWPFFPEEPFSLLLLFFIEGNKSQVVVEADKEYTFETFFPAIDLFSPLLHLYQTLMRKERMTKAEPLVVRSMKLIDDSFCFLILDAFIIFLLQKVRPFVLLFIMM